MMSDIETKLKAFVIFNTLQIFNHDLQYTENGAWGWILVASDI